MSHTRGRIVAALALTFGIASCADVDPGAPQGPAAVSAASTANGRYIVKFTDRGRGMAALHAAGASVIHDLAEHGAAAAMIPEQAVFGLSHNPNIEFIEADPERYPSAQVTPYGISMVQATDGTFAEPSAAAIKVCIIDSGLYTGHADFQGLPVTGYDNPALQWNQDGCGHGTHVAGTIAAQNNSLGVVGVAPEAVALHVVRVFGDDCSWAYASDLVAALGQCRTANARVVSMSLGGGRKSKVEENAFKSAWSAGVLSIAAAGNDGTTTLSYPGSYASVVSVAAVDSTGTVASFSQHNSAVDIAAPGVGVLSTVPWVAADSLVVGGTTYEAKGIENAAQTVAGGSLVDGGLCDSATSAWSGKVVLCQRGVISFYDKVHNVQLGGGAAAVISNNVAGIFSGTLGDGYSSTIPAVSISMEDGQALVAAQLGQAATVDTRVEKPASGYEAWDGTSMATPHVSGVAALIWSYFPDRTNQEIRDALEKTAKDLGASGRDDYYGNGLVQAAAAYEYLADPPVPACKATGLSCGSGSECCSGLCVKKRCK